MRNLDIVKVEIAELSEYLEELEYSYESLMIAYEVAEIFLTLKALRKEQAEMELEAAWKL